VDNIKTIFASSILIKEFNKAISHLDKREYDKAILLLNKVKRKQEFKEVWLNLGVAYKGKNNMPKVYECFDKALDPKLPLSDGTFKSDWSIALSNLGLAYFAEEKDELAEICYKKVLEKDPLYYDAIWNLSLVKLRQYCSNKFDDLALAWTYYTYRFKRTNATKLTSDKPELMLWDFTSVHKDSCVVVLLEQGMGDNIMFGRYLSELEKYFGKIWIQCTPDMASLFSKYHTASSTSETDAEYTVPMCSLGKILNYIPDGEWLADRYIEKPRSEKLEIMCIWAGNTAHVNAHNRNVPPGWFDKLKAYGNLHSVVPRKGYSYMEVKDWASTIKYLENIDIVVTIDSSVAHLCGSLGKPCLVLMPLYDSDFRWGDSSMGFDNKWYKSVKVIRNPHSWEKTFQTVHSCLSAL